MERVLGLPDSRNLDFLSRDEIREIQSKKIKALVRYAWDEIPFYRRLWNRYGVSLDDINSLDDFIKKIPTFTLKDIRESINNYPPYGDYQGIDVSRVSRIMSSGGTTGTPRPYFQTKEDWDNVKILWSRVLDLIGVKPGDIVQISFGFSTLIAGPGCCDGVIELGATVVPTSTGSITPAEQQVRIAKDWGTTVLICTPTFALHLANTAKKIGIDPLKLNIRLVGTAAEPLPKATRERIDSEFNCKTLDIWGSVENGSAAGAECGEYAGIHILEDSFFYEIFDPESLKPAREGEDGVIVMTTLYRRAAPMIRYNTMDITSARIDRCGCGRNTLRLTSPLKGRADDMIKFKGIFLYPPAVEEIIRGNRECIGEFIIIADRIGDNDTLTVKVEVFPTVDKNRLKKELEERIKGVTGLRMGVELLPEGEVRRLSLGFGGYKSTHFIDKRPKYD
jgi:phenylacetate-CoA ligase